MLILCLVGVADCSGRKTGELRVVIFKESKRNEKEFDINLRLI